MTAWLIYLLAGALAGLVAGLFGLGGGIVVVPVLAMVFSWQGVAEAQLMQMAVATSLMTICVTSLASVTTHARYHHVQWRLGVWLMPALGMGSFAGAWLAMRLDSQVLQLVFAVFALVVAVRSWLPRWQATFPKLLKPVSSTLFGLLAGVFSALVGIGGGTLTVPYLLLAGQPIKHAVGTAAAGGLPIALAGVAGFILLVPTGDDVAASYIVWPAFFGIVCSSLVCAPLGARLARYLPSHWLQRLFAVLLITVAVYFLWP